MIPYQKEKIENAICFFAAVHQKKTGRSLDEASLYKCLAFLDFETFEETGRPALGLDYIAMERGPVPIEIYGARRSLKTECFEFVAQKDELSSREKFLVIAHGKPDLDYFSEYEKTKMKRIIEIFADRSIKAGLRSDASHERIKAWKKTWAKKKNSLIDYSLTFDKDPRTKKPEDLSFAEECFLTAEALAKSGA
ncbi:MAG: SocA family protein [Syntrophorhabdus sp.]|jgi:hypothetical protein|nr:SocA family protein [Syntrophorhabdus sp.]